MKRVLQPLFDMKLVLQAPLQSVSSVVKPETHHRSLVVGVSVSLNRLFQ